MGHGSVKGIRLRKVPGPTNCRDAGLETGNLRALGVSIALCDGLRYVWSLWASNPEYNFGRLYSYSLGPLD
ncbi:hypothetical protein ACE6H2_009774 [Prunus campanulata]